MLITCNSNRLVVYFIAWHWKVPKKRMKMIIRNKIRNRMSSKWLLRRRVMIMSRSMDGGSVDIEVVSVVKLMDLFDGDKCIPVKGEKPKEQWEWWYQSTKG